MPVKIIPDQQRLQICEGNGVSPGLSDHVFASQSPTSLCTLEAGGAEQLNGPGQSTSWFETEGPSMDIVYATGKKRNLIPHPEKTLKREFCLILNCRYI